MCENNPNNTTFLSDWQDRIYELGEIDNDFKLLLNCLFLLTCLMYLVSMSKRSKKITNNLFVYFLLLILTSTIPLFVRWAENKSFLNDVLGLETVSVTNTDPLLINTRNLDDQNLYIVSDVVDGDTIKVLVGEEEVGIRLIGVDTPETVAPRQEVECFGKQASNFTKDKLENKKVYLLDDETQDNADRYGRLLRYVILEDESLFNYDLIKLGFANEYTYRTQYIYWEEFKAAEKYASENEIGLWGEECK